MKQKGFAIILVLATLVLLALLAYIYIKLALIDRNIARNYMDNKRAKLIAQSGVDYAIARLQENPLDISWQQTKLIKINGIDTKYTESSGSTYGENRDIFRVNAKDCNSMINVNDGLGNARIRVNLARMINILAKQVIGAASPNIGSDIIGDTEEKRPPQGYSSLREVKAKLKATYGAAGDDYYNQLEPFITTHAWQDEVANPAPLSSDVIDVYPVKYNKGVYRYGRSFKADGNELTTPLIFADQSTWCATLVPAPSYSSQTIPESVNFNLAIWGLDELNPQWIEIVKRSPVNVNLASTAILKTLLTDLKGFFCIERPINRPKHFSAYGVIQYSGSDYAPTTDAYDHDELAFLYTTDAINPAVITEEIRSCIEERASLNPPNIDYSTLWFKGPFKTWRQFNAFCDNLVKQGVLSDTRNTIFYEYYIWKDPSEPCGCENEGHLCKCVTLPPFFCFCEPLLYPWREGMRNSSYALEIASQAMADVLKANFNPNLHLNELNPDANIRTLVDKTDLIVPSTEFCFTSMGHFLIESEGFILKPTGSDNRVISNAKIDAVARVFNVYRQTNQAQFLWTNTVNDMLVSTTALTNNAMTLEIGPEPMQTTDAGGNIVARKNEYSGYIALPTLKAPDYASATIICHFTKDFDADKHADLTPNNLTDHNIADKYASVPGPYVYGDNASKYLLAKSFREGDGKSLDNYPMADLRIDGAYIERFAGLAYQYSSNILKNSGVASYWIKPWFMPEMTGKERTYFSLTKFTDIPSTYSAEEYRYLTNWFVPSHVDFSDPPYPPGIESDCETYDPYYLNAFWDWHYLKAFHPMSFLFGFNLFGTTSGQQGGGIGRNTPTLNHIAHSTHAQKNYMKAGQWLHVTFSWTITKVVKPPLPASAAILINGVALASTSIINSHAFDKDGNPTELTATVTDYLPPPNPGSTRLRIGEPGRSSGVDSPHANWTCDSTIDEFYIFNGSSTTPSESIWQQGRYYKPVTDPVSEYTSVNLTELLLSKIPSATAIGNPDGSSPPVATLASGVLKIIGLAWTWFAEDVDASGNPILRNYKDHNTVVDFNSLPALEPDINVYLEKSGSPSGPYNLEGFQAVDIQTNSAEDVLRYKVRFIWETSLVGDEILLYSPIFDDISIYYKNGIQFLSYTKL